MEVDGCDGMEALRGGGSRELLVERGIRHKRHQRHDAPRLEKPELQSVRDVMRWISEGGDDVDQ